MRHAATCLSSQSVSVVQLQTVPFHHRSACSVCRVWLKAQMSLTYHIDWGLVVLIPQAPPQTATLWHIQCKQRW